MKNYKIFDIISYVTAIMLDILVIATANYSLVRILGLICLGIAICSLVDALITPLSSREKSTMKKIEKLEEIEKDLKERSKGMYK